MSLFALVNFGTVGRDWSHAVREIILQGEFPVASMVHLRVQNMREKILYKSLKYLTIR